MKAIQVTPSVQMFVDDKYYDFFKDKLIKADRYCSFYDSELKKTVKVHSYVYKKEFGEKYDNSLDIHHIDFNPFNNQIANLSQPTDHNFLHKSKNFITAEHKESISQSLKQRKASAVATNMDKWTAIFKEHSNKTLKEIGELYGISEQAVCAWRRKVEGREKSQQGKINEISRQRMIESRNRYVTENKLANKELKISNGIFLSFEQAKIEAKKIASSKEEYKDKYKSIQGLHSQPDRFYSEWQGWKDFLGTEDVDVYERARLKKIADGVVLPYEQARIEACKIASTKQTYLNFYKTVKGLPSNPDRFYPEFTGWGDFLNLTSSNPTAI